MYSTRLDKNRETFFKELPFFSIKITIYNHLVRNNCQFFSLFILETVYLKQKPIHLCYSYAICLLHQGEISLV